MEMVDWRGRVLAVTPAAVEVLRSDPDLRFELAIDTVLVALPEFRARLADGRWQSICSRLSTYFVGALVLDFPNIYRSWLARWSRSAAEEHLDLLGAFDIESPQRSPESTVEARDEVVRLIGTLPTNVRKGVALMGFGYTISEAAQLVGISARPSSHQESRSVRAGAGHLEGPTQHSQT